MEADKLLFDGNQDLLCKLNQELEDLIRKRLEYERLEIDYIALFLLQSVQELSTEQLKELRKVKASIYSLIKPEFEDLDDYSKFRVILDFISGMTDQFALNHYQKLSGQKII